jgi:hypothetical protein
MRTATKVRAGMRILSEQLNRVITDLFDLDTGHDHDGDTGGRRVDHPNLLNSGHYTHAELDAHVGWDGDSEVPASHDVHGLQGAHIHVMGSHGGRGCVIWRATYTCFVRDYQYSPVHFEWDGDSARQEAGRLGGDCFVLDFQSTFGVTFTGFPTVLLQAERGWDAYQAEEFSLARVFFDVLDFHRVGDETSPVDKVAIRWTGADWQMVDVKFRLRVVVIGEPVYA